MLLVTIPLFSGCLSAQETSTPVLSDLVTESAKSNAFAVVSSSGQTASLFYDSNDHKGVIRAIGDLQADIERVTGKKPQLSISSSASGSPVIIGSLGKSKIIDKLVASGKLDVSDLEGKWESFVITTIEKPMAGADQALVIVGSDKRGTIYGVYELSKQLGVSPWYWWADVPAQKRKQAYITPGRYESGEPKVKYRGIFINDEEPCFGPWAREKFGGINSKMYAHMFELILRLRGNYLWPAMWSKSIYEDDPKSAQVADEYGIVLGTSHHEPMTRAHADWGRAKDKGNGQWNYATNEEGLKKFWIEGIERNKDYEVLTTLGMRGDGDTGMNLPGGMDAGARLMEKIVADQRQIIKDVKGVDPATVPQMWALYKEVTNFYDHGVRLPDDVTMLWCDDNWGNIRRLPSPEERKRSGRAGIYYHFDYVGGPVSYKWINTNPLPKIWEQMNMAYHYGADRIWVVNVGDLKPMETPIDFFLTFAWDPEALPKEKIGEYTVQWAKQQFGPKYAEEIADIVAKYAKYNGWRKHELLKPDTFSFVNHLEADRVQAAWQDIIAKAEKINEQLPAEYRDAYYQLVLHPTKASGTVSEIYLEAGRSQLYAAQGRVSANDHAQRARELFQLEKELTKTYHTIADGKWNHMMAQTKMGHTSWRDPSRDIMPRVTDVKPKESASLGVAIEGSQSAWPGESKGAVLPAMDSLNQQTRWIDVFKRGNENVDYLIKADKPWVRLSKTSGTLGQDQRIIISVDWKKIPAGEQRAVIMVSGPEGQNVPVQLNAIRSDKFTPKNTDAFGGLTGPTAIAADSAVKSIPVNGVRWERIPDYGRGSGGMSVFPVTAESVVLPQKSACMEYPVFIAKAGKIQVDFITGVALKVQTDRSVRFAVSFDDQEPQIVDLFAGQSTGGSAGHAPAFRGWDNWVKDNAMTLKTTLQVDEPGVHTLKIWMLDPGVVLQKIIIHDEELSKSYFGPPVSD